jgi:hypothetical protein
MDKAIKLRMENMSYGDIAKYFSIPKPTVQARLKPFFGKDIDAPAFKIHRADLFAGQQARVLSAITDADIKKASLRDKVISAGILFDKERLERGQSTSNSSIILSVVRQACSSIPGAVQVEIKGNIPQDVALDQQNDD